MCICWNCMEVEIRSFDCVNIILWQSGPIYAHPSAHHSATVVSWLPLSLPSPFWPQGLCTSLCPCTPHVTGFLSPFVPRKFPLCRQNLPGTFWRNSPGILIYFCLRSLMCGALTTFCYFLVYCLLLLPESELHKSEAPSVTVSPASKSLPGTFTNNLSDEWAKLTISCSPPYGYEIWGWQWLCHLPRASWQESRTSGFKPGPPGAQVPVLNHSDAVLLSALLLHFALLCSLHLHSHPPQLVTLSSCTDFTPDSSLPFFFPFMSVTQQDEGFLMDCTSFSHSQHTQDRAGHRHLTSICGRVPWEVGELGGAMGMCRAWLTWLTSLFQSKLTLASLAFCQPVSTPAC